MEITLGLEVGSHTWIPTFFITSIGCLAAGFSPSNGFQSFSHTHMKIYQKLESKLNSRTREVLGRLP